MNEFAVFVKPWRHLPLPELAKHIRQLGFRSIELPIRPEYAVEPDSIEKALPEAKRILGEEGIDILNVTVALPLDDERLYMACASAGITLNRVMFSASGQTYQEAEDAARHKLDAGIPFCEQYGVQIGVQNHHASLPSNALGLHRLIKDYDPAHVGAIWDAAHNSLHGIRPEHALDVVQSHLCIVNLKNAYWQRVTGPEAVTAEWQVYWTSGRHGLASWPRVIDKIKSMAYDGPICLTAEYARGDDVNRLIVEDLAYARSLFGEVGANESV